MSPRTPDIGVGVREDRVRIDFARLRASRRERVFAAMDRLDVDVCLFGREANGRYLAGQRRLWTSSTRAWIPTCIAVRATRRVHVMALGASTEDAPEDVGADDVFGRSFDPETTSAIYAAVPGLPDARRIGVDGLSVGMRAMLGRICPDAEVVGFEATMRRLRRKKLPAEIACLRVAVAITESALQRAADALRPGRTGAELQARFLERTAELGAPTFGIQGTFRVARPTTTPPWGFSADAFAEGEPVVLSGGALWSGYEGPVGRTWWCGDTRPRSTARERFERWRRVTRAVVDACRPGASGADLDDVWAATGEPPPTIPFVYAVGLGHEGPIAGSASGPAIDASQALESDMVVGVRVWIHDDGGGHFGEELVHVSSDGPELLTTMSHGPIARARARPVQNGGAR